MRMRYKLLIMLTMAVAILGQPLCNCFDQVQIGTICFQKQLAVITIGHHKCVIMKIGLMYMFGTRQELWPKLELVPSRYWPKKEPSDSQPTLEFFGPYWNS